MDQAEEATNNFQESSDFPEKEEVDPRVQGELEKLNQSTDDINRWECELEDYRRLFREVLVEASVKLDEQMKKIGRPVDESKPYWEARRVARQAQLEAQKATQEFQRAVEILRAAKETIALAEQRLLEEDSRMFDSAWQEMLNHATQRVMEAELARTRSEAEHKKTSANYTSCTGVMKQMEKKLKRNINKSRPYFELKAKYYIQLEQLKRRVDERQAKLAAAKAAYRTALANLETISEEIHAQRRAVSGAARERGVGCDGDHEDIANFKMESDGLSMLSVCMDGDTSQSTSSSEEETDSSPTSSSSPLDAPFSFSPSSSHPPPSVGPDPPSSPLPCGGPLDPDPDLEQPCGGPHPLGGSGPGSPALGPRSQCSGASSPDCERDQERGDRAEGAEGALAGLNKLTLTAAQGDADEDDAHGFPGNPKPFLHAPDTTSTTTPSCSITSSSITITSTSSIPVVNSV